jgi:hypothetical protein
MQGDELPQSFSERATTGRRAHMNPLAAGVLRHNSIKTWTKPAPSLYPHQWSWDSAFIALGLAHVDNHRATSELETLFASQWTIGKLPHIVFNPEAPPRSYFPDAERWNSSALSADAPEESRTTGLCQPPVHAIALWRIWESARGKEKRRVVLDQISEYGFAQYFEPFTGEPLGSKEQSWTAAVALDMLAAETVGSG